MKSLHFKAALAKEAKVVVSMTPSSPSTSWSTCSSTTQPTASTRERSRLRMESWLLTAQVLFQAVCLVFAQIVFGHAFLLSVFVHFWFEMFFIFNSRGKPCSQ